jgi:hypothetical protein
MIGRGIRTFEGKEFVKVIDVCGNVKRFGRVETFEIVPSYEGSNLLRLRSDAHWLTNWDFVSNRDIEKAPPKSDIITFGKYANNGQGTPITEIPDSYLEWGAENLSNMFWKNAFKNEIKRRLSLVK